MKKMQNPTIAETVFWAICGIIAILIVLSIPFIDNYYKNKEAERILGRSVDDENVDF